MTSEPRAPRLVVDTNLLVGHLFRPQAGGLARVVELWRRGEVRACVSAAVLREVRATLGRLPVDPDRRQVLLDLLADPERTELHEEIADSGFRCDDPADDKFLHLAVAAGADALITSDRALLAVPVAAPEFPVPVLKAGQWLRHRDR